METNGGDMTEETNDERETKVVVRGDVLVMSEDGGGFIPFEVELGESGRLDVEPIHIHDLQETEEAYIQVSEVAHVHE